VIDFGLARAPGHEQITVAKTLGGSVYYASPEQVWGQTLDNRSDIYALGVVLYERVTEHRLFTVRTLPELTQAIVSGPLRQPSALNGELSPELEQIVLTAMARKRDDRYEHATLMAQDLRGLRLQAPSHTVSPAAGSQLRQPGQREGVVVRPPKRPQAQRPRYVDWEATQPPGSEPNNQEQASNETNHESASRRVSEQTDDVPTRRLNPEPVVPTIEQAAPTPETRRTLWKHLQRIFKAE